MSALTTKVLPLLLLAVVVAVVGGAIAFSVMASNQLPSGPVDIVWDKAACAACGMHVGEPPFAAQVTTKDGRLHTFDDPGCLFVWLDEQHRDVHSLFFRHHKEARWLAPDEVAFATVAPTPMGFGLGAVDRNVPGAIDLDTARRQCLEHATGHGGKK